MRKLLSYFGLMIDESKSWHYITYLGLELVYSVNSIVVNKGQCFARWTVWTQCEAVDADRP